MELHSIRTLENWNLYSSTYPSLASNLSFKTSELYSILFECPLLPDFYGPWLAGGSVFKAIQGLPLDNSDLDFFVPKQKIEYCRQLLSAKCSLISTNFYTYTYNWNCKLNNKSYKIQLIHNIDYTDPQDVLENFDFTICQFLLYLADDSYFFICGNGSLQDLHNKEIKIHKLRNGISTLQRLVKYSNCGFTAKSETLELILRHFSKNPHMIKTKVKY